MPVLDFAPPAFHVMAKPSGPLCNLDCSYCFYLEKMRLFPGGGRLQMSDAVLERFVREYIDSQHAPVVPFAWQGGEPTLLGVNFFRRAVTLQARYARGKQIENAFQTNGTLLDDEWGRFLAAHRFLVGLSIDGPREMHDAYRVDKGQKPTHARVMQGLEILKRHKVQFNILTTVHPHNVGHPLEVYRFLKGTGCRHFQFIPIVRPVPSGCHSVSPGAGEKVAGVSAPTATAWTVDPAAYGRFLIRIFDEWVARDVGRYFVQIFDVALGAWAEGRSSLCVFAPACGDAVAIEHNGDVYACDHFVFPEHRLGNIMEQSLGAMVGSPAQRHFARAKSSHLPRSCRECDVLFACHGGCPKDRFAFTADGEPGLNYLCPGYRAFFRHIRSAMETMTDLLRRGRAPRDVMKMGKRR